MSNGDQLPDQPKPFLKVRIQDFSNAPSVTGLCVGYERSEWRAVQFADHIMEWLPEFALTHSELVGVSSGNMVNLVREAARKVYQTKKFENRGEFGELFLHAAVRQVFGSLPAISKIFYKSALNDTMKGFDAVHVVGPPGQMELWLGEVKFYDDFKRAVRDVVKELEQHTKTDYLKSELLLIRGKIDSKWPHAAKLQELLDGNKSLDEIFDRACIPVLLTYDSECLNKFTRCDDSYQTAFEEEMKRNHAHFKSQSLPQEITIHLMLLPLNTKTKLIKILDEKLKTWQAL